ncbi:helix-turn-helix domain-containing protein [Mycobacterium sp. 155]|uniref:helix-turn-helix domain-containing protein n=1 Tax=Mycobacterium sp. 155 TaxID=1157943 RepID=UPI001E35AD42|nr:helix-turn-helix transcriptional regulator [Mycobacterium sp. 155]
MSRQIAGVPQSEIEQALAQALGRRLCDLREARGLTQEVVAEASGMSRNHYQLLERGLSNRKTKRPANPRLSTLVALSEVLGVSVPELIDAIFADSN